MDIFYRKDAAKAIGRYKEWFKEDGKEKYIINLIPKEWKSYNYDLWIDPKTPKLLSQYDFTDRDELYRYIDAMTMQIQKYWEIKLDWNLDDDMVPTHTVKLGYAEQAAAISGENPKYSNVGQTSYLEPFLKEYESIYLDKIRFLPKNKWAAILEDSLTYLSKKAENRFFVESRLDASNPSDLAFEFRGKDLFTDFYDNPEGVKNLLDICCRESIKFVEYFRSITKQVDGGYPLTWHGGTWTPGNTYAHDGDNIADQVSGKIFTDFLIPFHNKMSEHFGGCVFGREAKSEHLWKEIPKISMIKAWAPRSLEGIYEVTEEVLERIIDVTGDLPLILESDIYERFLQYTNIVKKRNIKAFFIAHCRDLNEAKEILKIVRSL
ncbi:MAG: hypothetical protein M1365_02480 [Actinobacteria bacterium]|nr:hypothetical protein [Actinomycetota bacterium]